MHARCHWSNGTVLREYGLEINTKKTKVLVTSTTATAAQVTCDNAILEQVKSFRYLGSIITDTYATVERK